VEVNFFAREMYLHKPIRFVGETAEMMKEVSGQWMKRKAREEAREEARGQ
jgi:hypothetical protein